MQPDRFGWGDNIHDRIEWSIDLMHTETSLPSSLTHLLASNKPLSSSDVDHINHFKDPILEKISEFDAQQDSLLGKIYKLERDLQLLMATRRPFDKQVAACEVMTSPFRRIPDDILYVIVKHCPVKDVRIKNHIPFRLAQVCKRWRKVVLGTSSLWKEVHLEWPRHTDAMNQFKHFARLSRSLPLALGLDERVVKAADLVHHHGALPFLKDLVLDGTSCQRLSALDIYSSRSLQLLNVLKDNKLPLLKSYTQVHTMERLSDEDEAEGAFEILSMNDLLKNAPQLTHLWFGGNDSFMGPLFDLPQEGLGHWSHLTTLHYWGPLYVDEWHSLLKICINLESAWVRVSAPEDSVFETPDISLPHTHEHIRELIIQLLAYDEQILLPFAGFRFPKLISMQVGFVGANFSPLPADLHPGAFADVFPSLENLVVVSAHGIDAYFEEVLSLLLAVPTTKTLLITFSGKYYMEFLEFIRKPQEDGSFPLPALQALEIEFLPSPANDWCRMAEEALTASLFETCRLRSSNCLSRTSKEEPLSGVNSESSLPPKLMLRDLTVRYNPGDLGETGITSETKRRMVSYFENLGGRVSRMDDINMLVSHNTEGIGRFASPVMREFMNQFAFWRMAT